MFQNNVLAGAAAASTDAYTIDNSCRFYSGDSTYMQRDYGAGGDPDKWTLSFWIKRTKLTYDTAHILNAGDSINYTTSVQFDDDDRFRFWQYSGSYQMRLITTPVFRDPGAWYHIVIVYDSAQDVSADRVTISFNGVKITAFDTEEYPAENLDSFLGTDVRTGFGRYISYEAGPYLDAYLAEVHYVNGSALAVSEFGETNDDGVWAAKEYTGSYGTGGFFLDFEDSSDLGNDVSGNNNDMTTSGLAAADQMTDTPTNNHCTFNSVNQSSSVTLLDGNLVIDGNGGGAYYPVGGTHLMQSGKWYIEFKQTSSVNVVYGVVTANQAGNIDGSDTGIPGDSGTFSDGAGYNLNGTLYEDGSSTASWGDTFTTNDIIGVAINADNGKVWFAKNNTWQASGDPAGDSNPAATVTAPMVILCSIWGTAGASGTMRSAEGDWTYSAPTGFNAINTSNIAAPAVTDPSEYYQTGPEYAGNASTQTITFDGNANMQPDIVWIKATDGGTKDHVLTNSVRGTGFNTVVNLALAEDAATDVVTAFNTDGFSLGDGSELFKGSVNGSSINYVSWNWKESATSGMDIVTWTGNATNRTISHSLGVVPKFMVVRGTSARDWIVYHSETASDPSTAYMRLDTEAAVATESTIWNDTMPTSSVFSIGTGNGVNANTETYIGYLFAEIEGFSRFSIYTGTGNADGPFIYCGFRPQLVIIKKRAGGGANIESWNMYDTTINPYNTGTTTGMYILRANDDAASAQASNENIDILSNGFKIRSSGDPNNGNTDPYLVMAWAYNPFGGDGSAPAPAR